MSRNKVFDYKSASIALRKVGFKPKYGTRKKGSTSPQAKAALRKQWEKVRLYIKPTLAGRIYKYKFKFVETNTPQKRAAMEGMNPKVRTPTGFFVRIPTGVKSYRIKFNKRGVEIHAVGKRGGKRVEKIYKLNARNLAKNPEKEIRRVTEIHKPHFIEGRLVVNGHDSHRFEHNDFAEFEEYMAEFFEQSQDPSIEGKLKNRYHGDAITPKQFTDIFHVKVINQSPSTDVSKKKRKNRKKKAVKRTKAKTVRRRRSRN